MKLEDQVCTLEQAKKLHELGIECNSLWVWKVNNTQSVVVERKMGEWATKYAPMVGNSLFPALTVSELGVMLPSETYTQRTGSENSTYPNWEWVDDGEGAGWGNYNTQVEAAADMLIIYLEKNKLSAQQCNERLMQ